MHVFIYFFFRPFKKIKRRVKYKIVQSKIKFYVRRSGSCAERVSTRVCVCVCKDWDLKRLNKYQKHVFKKYNFSMKTSKNDFFLITFISSF